MEDSHSSFEFLRNLINAAETAVSPSVESDVSSDDICKLINNNHFVVRELTRRVAVLHEKVNSCREVARRLRRNRQNSAELPSKMCPDPLPDPPESMTVGNCAPAVTASDTLEEPH